MDNKVLQSIYLLTDRTKTNNFSVNRNVLFHLHHPLFQSCYHSLHLHYNNDRCCASLSSLLVALETDWSTRLGPSWKQWYRLWVICFLLTKQQKLTNVKTPIGIIMYFFRNMSSRLKTGYNWNTVYDWNRTYRGTGVAHASDPLWCTMRTIQVVIREHVHSMRMAV